ncbi:MAG: cytochrome c oxidase subunit II [Thermoleophilaceae bacterium]|nr:cytochrome c oxidase subunit II [Thermoleophilaceae bacterium]
MRSSRTTLALTGALLLLLVAAPAAFGGIFTFDEQGSQNGKDISFLYNITLIIGLVIFLVVEGAIIYCLVKYRARRGGPDAEQIRGNTPLEIGWTVGAAVILVGLTVLTFLYLGDITDPPASSANGYQAAEGVQFATRDQPKPPGNGALEIDVNGQQYMWRFDYPGSLKGEAERLYSFYEMVVPTNTTVTLNITASDVIHSWWIPTLGGKADATPGYTNETWFKIEKPGIYKGQCAELCGENHADMLARVRAVPPDEFRAWAAKQGADIKAAQVGLGLQRLQGVGSE